MAIMSAIVTVDAPTVIVFFPLSDAVSFPSRVFREEHIGAKAAKVPFSCSPASLDTASRPRVIDIYSYQHPAACLES
jgi:hypothetical protein